MTILELALRELEQWEQLTIEFLHKKMNDATIDVLVEQQEATPQDFLEQAKANGISKPFANAIRAISIIRSLKKLLPLPISENGSIPVQMAARLAFLSFHAGFNIGLAGPQLKIDEDAPLVEWARPLVPVSHGGLRVKGGRKPNACIILVRPVTSFLFEQSNKIPTAKKVLEEMGTRIDGIAAKNSDSYDDIDRLIEGNKITKPMYEKLTVSNLKNILTSIRRELKSH